MAGAVEEERAYRLTLSEIVTTPVIFASPHSGLEYPQNMLDRTILDLRRLRSSEDAFVDRLLEAATGAGAGLLSARLPRAWVDLNRAEDELDPALIEGLGRIVRGPRVMAGLGVIPRVVSGGRAIYAGKISRAEADERIATCWRPYHAALAGVIERVRAQFGRAILFDMHSMPSEAVSGSDAARAPDIVLGDRFGESALRVTADAVADIFRSEGLSVARNVPFAGAYITQRYGRPAAGVEVIQIEIRRSLYMDEALIEPSGRFAEFSALMERVVIRLAALGRETLGGGALAAE